MGVNLARTPNIMRTETKLIIAASLALMATFNTALAQKGGSKTTFQVAGNCEHCKERIETALDVKGVKRIDWSAKSGSVTVVADTTLVSPKEMQKRVADAGHDTPFFKAEDKSYKALPACCKYTRMK